MSANELPPSDEPDLAHEQVRVEVSVYREVWRGSVLASSDELASLTIYGQSLGPTVSRAARAADAAVGG